MNNQKFSRFMKAKKNDRLPKNYFEGFIQAKPTRKQFSKFLTGLVLEADHIWLLTIGIKK